MSSLIPKSTDPVDPVENRKIPFELQWRNPRLRNLRRPNVKGAWSAEYDSRVDKLDVAQSG